jgi:hypothetical protein
MRGVLTRGTWGAIRHLPAEDLAVPANADWVVDSLTDLPKLPPTPEPSDLANSDSGPY